jgi:hypothetical protein
MRQGYAGLLVLTDVVQRSKAAATNCQARLESGKFLEAGEQNHQPERCGACLRAHVLRQGCVALALQGVVTCRWSSQSGGEVRPSRTAPARQLFFQSLQEFHRLFA